jgi:hypothetical protein
MTFLPKYCKIVNKIALFENNQTEEHWINVGNRNMVDNKPKFGPDWAAGFLRRHNINRKT